MSVYDKVLTRCLEEANEYFYNRKYWSQNIFTIHSSDAMQALGFAVTIFQDPTNRKQIYKKIQNSHVTSNYIGDSELMTAAEMCRKYARGTKEFDRSEIEIAHRLCVTLVTYLKTLENGQV